MRLLFFTLLLVCVGTVFAYVNHVTVESMSVLPAGWRKGHAASKSHKVEVHVFVKQQNTAELEEIFHSVSNPSSSEYGKHWSHEDINSFVAPTQHSVQVIEQWLDSHHVPKNARKHTPNKDIIKFTIPIEKAEEMLHTKYHHFHHDDKNIHVIRADSYKVPEHVRAHIDFVGPTVRLPAAIKAFPHKAQGTAIATKQKKNNKLKLLQSPKGKPNYDCSQGTTPDCLKGIYNVGSYVASSNTSIAVTGFLGQFIALSDLTSFFQQYDPSHARTPTIVGPNDQTNPGVEASLDIQYSMGVAPGVPATFWSTPGTQPGNDQNEPFLAFLFNLAAQPQVPWVVSTSYGDNENTVNYDYAVRVNQEFVKAGVRGITLLFSSGDGGVAGGQSGACTTFIPTYPAGSPFITSVGATTTPTAETGVYFSSGGFTNYWTTPKYQAQAVSDYLNKYGQNLPPANLYNATGRGFPDVSFQGTNFPVYTGGM